MTAKQIDSLISVDLFKAARRSEEISPRYSDDDLLGAIERYKKFLLLCGRFPDAPIAPCRDIDDIWHLHMLKPVAYHDDCIRLFGYILDHDGGFGAAEDEAPELDRIFGSTATLWEQEFGEPYVQSAQMQGLTKCTRNCVSRCQRACKTKSSQLISR